MQKVKLYQLQSPQPVQSAAQKDKYNRACRDKQKFFSKRDAQEVIRQRHNPNDYEPYRCVFCQSWHIGHTRAYYRALNQGSLKVPQKQRNVYLNQIRRLQEENRLLASALTDECRLRQNAYRWYRARLESRFLCLADLLLGSLHK